MPSKSDRSPVSILQWILMIIVAGLPCIGCIFVPIWAFSGNNETKKNYFKAQIALFLFAVSFWIALTATGLLPSVNRQLRAYLDATSNEQSRVHKPTRSN